MSPLKKGRKNDINKQHTVENATSDNKRLLQWPLMTLKHNPGIQDNLFYSRPYGSVSADLDVDFDQTDHSEIITRLLAACLRDDNGKCYLEDAIWLWTMQKRLQGLLAIVAATHGVHIPVLVRCLHNTCNEALELPLDLTEFCEIKNNTHIYCHPDNDNELKVRLPNGMDQLNWLNHTFDKRKIYTEMAATLVEQVNGHTPVDNWTFPEAWIDTIEAELEQHDRLLTLQLGTCCPACNKDIQLEFDLEDHLLNILASEQKRLLNQIHRLASIYNWTEREILALTPKRRDYYLARVEEGMFHE